MMEDTDWRPSPCPHCGEFREASRNPICKNPKCAASSSRHTSSTTAVDMSEEITRLRAQLAAAEADKLAAMERVREAAAKACVCTIAERRIDNSLEHERKIEARIHALDLSTLAEEEK